MVCHYVICRYFITPAATQTVARLFTWLLVTATQPLRGYEVGSALRSMQPECSPQGSQPQPPTTKRLRNHDSRDLDSRSNDTYDST